nr:cytochrome c [uncultured Undibacterium sp.]
MKMTIKSIWTVLKLLLVSGVVAVLLFAWYGYQLGDAYQAAPLSSTPSLSSADAQLPVLEHGAYLVKIADCMACHTARGGAPFAGGRIMQSEFGQFVTPNITPDKQTGIGNWTAEDFWNALHNGKSKDGRLLYPAFPFTNYTHITRSDADAMFAYLQSQPAVSQSKREHSLAFPYNQAFGLALWRAMYFQPGELKPQSDQSLEWNRGAYLTRGLAHCSACHSSRNSLGANGGSADFSGGEMAGIGWYAPSLTAKGELNVSQWTNQDLAQLLQHGVNRHSSVNGPMAEVVSQSLQHLSDKDASAMANYLRALPQQVQAAPDLLDQAITRTAVSKEQMQDIMLRGEVIYRAQCAECHGKNGEGQAGIYPALRGNASLQTKSLSNPIRMILAGGFAPVTKANPRPYSMPPFAPFLDDGEVALVLSYTRNAWGNRGSVVSAAEVNPYRTASLD